MNYEINDSFYAIVTGKTQKGIFLKPDDSQEEAFAYSFGGLTIGTKVLCSLKKPAQESKKMLVYVDSVCA